jgi:hypothetical protein
MANAYRDIDKEKLIELAQKYIDECEAMIKEVPTGKGVQVVKERKVPTIKYWAMQWLKKEGFDFYTREHLYSAIANSDHPLSYTLKKIRETFDAVAEDIVANEGKGIFYAKNRLGMSDRVDTKQDTTFRLVDDTTKGSTDIDSLPPSWTTQGLN